MIKIKIDNLNFAYSKTPVLNKLSFGIEENSMIVLLGLNGSGKSTLIKLLTNLLTSPKESVLIDGKEISSYTSNELSKLISYVPQEISSDNDFLVKEYVTFGLMNTIKFYKQPTSGDYEKIAKILRELNIEDLASQKMNELSGGQRQLVVIARAIAQDADIIILDEPKSSLDFKNQELIINILDILHKKGKTIIFSCHNPSVPLLLNSQVIVLKKGTLKMIGNAREVLTPSALKEIYSCNLISCAELPYTQVSLIPR